ncbi:hypothetical protein G0Q06_01395 [Puniceicoccales bacterium CK1056]|uniref:Uncharacterized protein n=1 Tax=Oceanipulchritudo coccoides TaxID=2706888 RepID=A0A6B2LZ95_9BACT|nr:hypothetical protein [Oceanipulchritudo coccoides]NDV61097.1 hypothetical protein [Oceanipulchritudo coccoides]
MSLKLEACYAKKIGLPGYSSHGLTLTLTQEIADIQDIPGEVHATYMALQEAIDRELQVVGWLPHQEDIKPLHQNSGANGSPRNRLATVPGYTGWKCSEKQRQLIERVAQENGLSEDDLNALGKARYGKSVRDLNRLEASGLIDELLDNQRQPAFNGGNRSGKTHHIGRNQ